MRAFELIIEAAGGMYDRMLEKNYGQDIKFKKGEEILDLLSVEIFPQDKRATYKTSSKSQSTLKNTPLPADHREQMINDVNAYIKSQKSTIEQSLTPSPRHGAAMVVILGNKNKKLAFVKFADFKSESRPPIYWQTSQFTAATGWAQTGKGLSSTQKTAPLKLDPYKLVTPGTRYPINGLINTITTNLKTRTDLSQEFLVGVPSMLSDLYKGGSPTPTPNLNEHAGILEVVLGETAAPIAMITGNRVSGAYDECEKQLLQPMGLTWKNFKEVSYGAAGGEISDSTIFAGDNKLIVSSKNKKGGASASLTGAMETVKKFPEEFGPKTKFYAKYKNILPILEILDRETNLDGVLQVSVKLNILNADEAAYLKSIYGKPAKANSIKNYPGLMTAYKAKALLGSKVKNAKGQTVIAAKGVDLNNPKYNLGYHLFGNVAKLVANHLNKDSELLTNFFKAVLNKADMVQVYTAVSSSDKGIWFSDFKVVWPPTFTGNIIIDHDFNTANAAKTKKLSFRFK
jgi:hypothetical protein